MFAPISYIFLHADGVTPYANKMVLASENRSRPAVPAQTFDANGSPLLTSISYTDANGIAVLYVEQNRQYQLVLKEDDGSELTRVQDLLPNPLGLQNKVTKQPARQLPRWRKALASVRSGAGRARVAFVGDSNTMGYGGGTGTNGLTGARVKSVPASVAQLLAKAGYNVNQQSVFGDAMQGIGYNVYDPRVGMTGDWATGSASNTSTTGGQCFRCAAGGVGVWSFTPTEDVDTFVLYTTKSAGLGALAVNLDGGATAATLDENAITQSNVTTTFNTTLGPHTLNVQRVSGNNTYIAAAHAFNSAKVDRIDVFNMGASGWTAGQWAYGIEPWAPSRMLPFIDPDLTVINLGINDWKDAGTPLVNFINNLQVVITAAKSKGGSVILMVPFPSQTTRASVAQQQLYYMAIRNLAVTNDCPMVDLETRYGSWAESSLNGFTYNDLHPNSLGYFDYAQPIANLMLT